MHNEVGRREDLLNEEELHFVKQIMNKTTMMAKAPTHIITPEKGEISSVLGTPIMNNKYIIFIIVELNF